MKNHIQQKQDAARGIGAHYAPPWWGVVWKARPAGTRPTSHLSEPAFELYPNPHDGSFSLLLTGEKGLYRYRVSDLTGRLLVQEQFSKERGKQTVPLHVPLRDGLYLLSIYRPDGTLAGVKHMLIVQ